jgi:TetR/AcrR family transcriptional regulator, tetracycline repressor protein
MDRAVGDQLDVGGDLGLDVAAVLARPLAAERGEGGPGDGAKAFSGTTLTDPAVVRRQEITFGNLIRQGFTLENAVRGLLPLHDFTIGFCVEEQAVLQVTASGDDSYALARRAELIGPYTAPLAVQAGQVIFGDPDTRFAELTALLLDAIARLRGGGS